LNDPTAWPGVYVKIGAMLNWISHVFNYYDENHPKEESLNSTNILSE
jgi:hypothetical protein